jgi:hypothetical protein
MRRDTAERIIHLVKASDDLFNELTLLTDEIEDKTERKAVRRALAELVLRRAREDHLQDRGAISRSAS